MKAVSDTPWVGPVPLSFKEAAHLDAEERKRLVRRQLVGREAQFAELTRVCQTHLVIEITAPSGVGKTSFIAGAPPFLEMAGFRVRNAAPWSDTIQAYDEFSHGR